jgi:hypothetical protein
MPLRYVILHHTGVAEPHYDLMFETGSGAPLKTFRVSAWPLDRPAQLVLLPDHRPHYLAYEGPISGARGWVRRVEAGTYSLSPGWCHAQDSPLRLELQPSQARFTLRLSPTPTLSPVTSPDEPH